MDAAVISPDKIIALLEKQLKLLETMAMSANPIQIGGFAVIYPPDGDPITFVNLSSQDDALSFYKYLADKLTMSREQSGFGAIKTGR